MATYSIKTRKDEDPRGKARVYFTCYAEDFARSFEKICADILSTHNCAIYYTADMTEEIPKEEREIDLGQMNLFVVPISRGLLSVPNRAMKEDVAFAKERHIPMLPIMLEDGIDKLYALPQNFGNLQYLTPYRKDKTEIPYKEKLKKYLDAVLTSDLTAKRVRAAFDAYVFLSYRKRDRRYAIELMKLIHRFPECRDLAIWYDEFLIPGEDFQESIARSLQNSRMVTLLVTPSLLEEANYIMQTEYPAAKASGADILPVEMVKTSHTALSDKYENFPECVDIKNNGVLRSRLAQTLTKMVLTPSERTPEHNFLIGLAYLNGIDVEVDAERAVRLIASAAEQGVPEAMEKLLYIFYYGEGVPSDYRKALVWAEKLFVHNKKCFGVDHPDTLEAWKYFERAQSHIYSKKFFLGNKAKKALRCEENLTEHMSRLLGEDHPAVVARLVMLCGRLLMNGNVQKSIKMKERVYACRCRTLGEVHPDTLGTLKELAFHYFMHNKIKESKEAYEKLYEGAVRLGGEEHIDALEAIAGLSDAYMALRDYPKALEWTEKKYAAFCKNDGEDSAYAKEALKQMEDIKKRLRRIPTLK